jgi:hypothetical protein
MMKKQLVQKLWNKEVVSEKLELTRSLKSKPV